MVSVALFIRAAAASIISTTAFAADMPQPAPQPQVQIQYQPIPVVVEQPMGAWYLRGFIGLGKFSASQLEFIQNPMNAGNFHIEQSSVGDTVFFGAGVGFEFNNFLRFDVTGEFRNKTEVNSFGSFTLGPGVFGDTFHGNVESLIFLANGFVDLFTWNCLTPFVGVGVGAAFNEFADLTDTGLGTSGRGIGRNTVETHFAWALHAGLAFNVTQNFTAELAFRHLNFGSISDMIDCIGGCAPDTFRLQKLTSEDFMLGMRWRFQPEPAPVMVQQAPVMLQQQPVMVPQQPLMIPQPTAPLSTRG